jgi:hypothetical protein
MANPDTPFGLRPIRHKSGAPYNGAANPYYINSSNSTGAIFIGDPMVRVAGGSNAAAISVPGAGDFAIGTLPEVEFTVIGTVSGATGMITGVVVAFAADPTALENVHRLDDTERVVWLCDDPDIVFEIQADGAITAAEIGLNATTIQAHAGSTVTGLSGVELDTTTGASPAADLSDQLRIVRAVNRVDNDTTLIHAKVEVVITQHTEAQGIFALDGTAGTLGI